MKNKKTKNTKKTTNKKNKQLPIIVIIGAILLILILLFFVFNKNERKELEKSLTSMGEQFYKDFYYDSVEKERLVKYKDIGIKVNLDNLEIYNNGINKDKIAKFKIKDKECDKITTMAIIYPEDPYEKDDYRIEVILECD